MTFDDLHYQDVPAELFLLFTLYILEEAARRTNHWVLHEFVKHVIKHNFIPGVYWREVHFENIEKHHPKHSDISIVYIHVADKWATQTEKTANILGTLESFFSVYFAHQEVDDIFQRAIEKFTELQIFKITYLLLHRASEDASSVQHVYDRLQDHLFDSL